MVRFSLPLTLFALLLACPGAAVADGVLDRWTGGRNHEFKPLAFSGNVFRDGIPSACGLMPYEVAGGAGDFRIQLPKDVADGRSAEFQETDLGIGLPIRGVYWRMKASETDAIGRTYRWKVEARENILGYRLKNANAGAPVWAIEAGRRVVDPGVIRNRATLAPVVNFLYDEGYNDHAQVIRTSSNGPRQFRHYTAGFSRAKFGPFEKKSTFAGIGIDRLLGKRFDWQNTALLIDSEERPKNAYLSSRVTARVFQGLSVSLEGGMFTNGYTYAPLRFSDHFVPSLVLPDALTPDFLKKMKTDAFGYWGVSVHYGVKF